MEYRSLNGNMPSSKDKKKSSGKDEEEVKAAVATVEETIKANVKPDLVTETDKEGNFRTLYNARIGDKLSCTICDFEAEYKNGVNQDLHDHLTSHN